MSRILRFFILAILLAAPLRAEEPFTLTDEQIMAALRAEKPLEGAVWAEALDLSNMTSGHRKALARKTIDEKPLTLKGVVYPHGIGTHANSVLSVDLKGAVDRFLAVVGLDDEISNKKPKTVFQVIVDGKILFDSGLMQITSEPKLVSVETRGAQRMLLTVTSPKNEIWDAHADWAGAMLILDDDASQRPESVPLVPPTSLRMFPPKFVPGDAPAVFGAKVLGCSPKRPFLHRVFATGKAPFKFSASGLPKTLKIDPQSGVITGQLEAPGAYDFFVGVSNAAGKIVVPFSILCGDRKLAQTPPMGWNAWNVFGETVTVDKVKEQADWLIKTGLAAQGFQYLILDDTWQARRDPDGSIFSNKRFGDITELADYLHERGLKLGIYSSPNLETCSGYAGSLGFEEKDAAAYAEWGVDYLKYDWCQVGSNKENTTPAVLKETYGKMRAALDKAPRDIVWALTPYGFGDPWTWAPEIGANSWFTTLGIQDTWESVKENGSKMHDLAKYAGPGRWNDPGWLMVGKFGVGTPRFTKLKASEQQWQVTQWVIANAPLIISCDLTQLDPNSLYPVTSSLLTNPEVLAVNQDLLGVPGKRSGGWETETWTKPLVDGTVAVALFNKSDSTREVGIKGWDLGKSGKQPVRDLWLRKDLGEFEDGYSALLPKRSAMLLKIGTPLAPNNSWTGMNKTAFLRPMGRWGDGFRWAWSRNGTDWSVANKVRLKPELGGKQMRDNSIERGADGTYHMVWMSGDNDKFFGHSSSPDALKWSEQREVPVASGLLADNLRQARHPMLFRDKKGAQWVIVFTAEAMKQPPRGWKIYALTTKDFKTFSEPQLLLDTPYSAADPCLIEANGRYALFYRDEDKRAAKVSIATSVLGPYDVAPDFESLVPVPEPVDPKKKKPAPPHDPGAPLAWGKEIENITLMPQGNEWLVNFYRGGSAQAQVWMKSKDLKNWDEMTPNMLVAKDVRLGNRVAVPETTLLEILRGN